MMDRDPTLEDDPAGSNGLSRRQFLRGGAIAGAAAALAGTAAPGVAAARPARMIRVGADSGATEGDLVLYNGAIHTMDGARAEPWTVASGVEIKAGRFHRIHSGGWQPGRTPPGTTVIDLQGRTVVPGIIDNHNHIILMGLRPGHHTPLENAYSVEDVQEIYAARREGRNRFGWWADRGPVPEGGFITTIGGFSQTQFAENRLPTREELDAAVSDRPVLAMVGFSGPSTTNSEGKEFFESKGVTVGENGSIGSGAQSQRALFALRQMQTLQQEKRSTMNAMAYATSLGVTTHFDQGGFPSTHTTSDAAAHFDRYRAHDAVRALHQEDLLRIRIRINFLHMEADPNVPEIKQRLQHTWPLLGDDMLKNVGIGEFTGGTSPFGGPTTNSEPWIEATRRVAQARWRNENHALFGPDADDIINGWQAVHAEFPIDGLRWTLAHVPVITREEIERLKLMDCAVNLSDFTYFGFPTGGPPYRMIWDSGIKVGLDSDGMQIAPMNPWIHAYYATTGRNAAGTIPPANSGQQLTREEVLRLYTSENGWFTFEEEVLGSIEPGKLADLVVLSDDYFAVPEEDLRKLRSVLTVVAGKVVHDDGVLSAGIA